MNVRAGKLRHRVTIRESTETRGDTGQITLTWSDLRTVWASVEPLRAQELLVAQQTEAQVTHRVRMRYWSDVTPQKQLVHDGRTFQIASVLNKDERNNELELICVEIL